MAVSTGHPPPVKWYLSIDGGGSSCTAALLSSSGIVAIGEAGPCNVLTIGIDAAVSVISSAVKSALVQHADLAFKELSDIPISSAWVALAGYDRPSLAPIVDATISELFKIPIGPRLTVSTDIDILSVKAAVEPLAEAAIVLVAGTGSIAMSYSRKRDRFFRTARVGGWGPLLGDDGSGFVIGKEALGIALKTSDLLRQTPHADNDVLETPAISKAVFAYFEEREEGFNPRDLLSTILAPNLANPSQNIPNLNSSIPPTKQIAKVAEVVLSLAESNEEAKRILHRGSRSLLELVMNLLEGQSIEQSKTALIMAGGLLQSPLYNNMVRKALSENGVEFGWVMNVDMPALEGARWLASKAN